MCQLGLYQLRLFSVHERSKAQTTAVSTCRLATQVRVCVRLGLYYIVGEMCAQMCPHKDSKTSQLSPQ